MDADQATRVADALAVTAAKSMTDITGLGESLQYAGLGASQLGYSVEETLYAIGLMGNAAIDASSAGTAARTIFARLAKAEGMTEEESTRMTDALDKIGFSLADANGNAKPLVQVLAEMKEGMSGFSGMEQVSLATDIAGMYASQGFLAMLNADEEQALALLEALQDTTGAAKKMAAIRMNTLRGGFLLIKSAAEGLNIAVGEKLEPLLARFQQWLIAKMPQITEAAVKMAEEIATKITKITDAVKTMTQSPEWENAKTMWDKIKVAWDQLIAEPFDAWWNGSGKAWMAEKAAGVGEGIGSALKSGLLTLLGVETGDALSEGANIGRSFMEGFLEGFDASQIADAIWEALKDIEKDAAKLLPGGEEPSDTSYLSAALMGYGAVKTAQVVSGVFKSGKFIFDGVKGLAKLFKGGGATEAVVEAIEAVEAGTEAGTAAKISGTAAEAAGAGAKAGGIGAKAIPLVGGLISLVEMGIDAYNGVEKSEEWTGTNSVGNKIASGAGAFFGGTGDGVLGEKDALGKSLDIGGGALKGAGIGAAIGSIVPGVGTAIGAAVGAGLGAVMSAIGGENIAKALSAAGEGIAHFFTEVVPKFFSEFWDALPGFFTQSLPYAIGFAAGKIELFFTETVPKFYTDLLEGIGGFFVENVPAALETVDAALDTFFLETVPKFFSDLWDGITFFLTETMPSVLKEVKAGISEFFTGVKDKITGFFSEMWDGVTSFLGGAADSFNAGYSDATGHAEGGIMTRPHFGMVAEDGAEAIIPLSDNRRGRGLALWEQAGKMLGVEKYAEGGIAGGNIPQGAVEVADSGVTVPVTIENITFDIDVNGGNALDAESLTRTIKDNVQNLTDEIAYRIAVSLQSVYANMPLAAQGV